MGVDIQTYRARIGTFRHSVGVAVETILCVVNFSSSLKTVGSVLFVGLLLLMAGVEPNPGPKEDEPEDTDPTTIIVSGLPDGLDKDTLELIFDKQGGGKITDIHFDSNSHSAKITFEQPEAVNIVQSKEPITILGKTIKVGILRGGHTEPGNQEPSENVVVGSPENLDKDTHESNFANTNKQGGCDGSDIYVDPDSQSAKTLFQQPEGHTEPGNQESSENVVVGSPESLDKDTQESNFANTNKQGVCEISDKNVDPDSQSEKTFFQQPEEQVKQEPTTIVVSGLPENIDYDMLEMIFENPDKQGGGKVRDINYDRKANSAKITFEQPEAVKIIQSKQPITIMETSIKIDIIGEGYSEPEDQEPTTIVVSGLPENIDKDMLEMIFENPHKHGGGKIRDINVDQISHSAKITFEQSEAVKIVQSKEPITIMGKTITIHILGDEQSEQEPTTIVVRGLPENIDKDMLELIFENPNKQGGGKVRDISVDPKSNSAKITFEQPEAVKLVQSKQPISLMGKMIMIDILRKGYTEQSEQEPTTIVVRGLPESIDKDMLELIFENPNKQGGGKIRDISVDPKSHSAKITFEQPEAVKMVQSKEPITIMGKTITIHILGDGFVEEENQEPTTIVVSDLPANIDKDMLELVFENPNKQGGGKIRDISYDRESNSAKITFEQPEAVKIVQSKEPITIMGKTIKIHILGVEDENQEPTTIVVSDLPANIDKDMLELIFEIPNKQGGGKIRDINYDRESNLAKITFEQPEAVKIVQSKEPITIMGKTIKIHILGVEDENQEPTTIVVSDLPANIDKDMLELIFENPNKQGGGKIRDISYDRESNSAKITFEQPKAVKIVQSKEPITIMGKTIKIYILGKEEENQESTTIVVSHLPANIDKDMLELIFENPKKQGGGKIRDINYDRDSNSAKITFEQPEAVKIVQSKEPIAIMGSTIKIHILGEGFTKTEPDNQEPRTIFVKGLPENIDKDTLELIFENADKQGGGKISDIIVDPKNYSAKITFEQPEAVKIIQRKEPLTIMGKTVKIDILGEEELFNGNKENVLRVLVCNLPKDVVQEELKNIFECNQCGDIRRIDIIESQCKAVVEFQHPAAIEIVKNTRLKLRKKALKVCQLDSDSFLKLKPKIDFFRILKRLGLQDKFPGKIQLRDIVTLDIIESKSDAYSSTSQNMAEIPWIFLRRLISTHSEARDMSVIMQDHDSVSALSHSLSFFSGISNDNSDTCISPLDISYVVLLCCDPPLKQIIYQKLYLCKLAVPFIYTDWTMKAVQSPTVAIWPLRSLIIESTSEVDKKLQSKEVDALALQSHVVAFARFGNPRYSKSKLLNSLLTSHGCKTFYNIDCPSGMTPRCVSGGQTEIFWLPTVGDRRDKFASPVTFLNMRGDIRIFEGIVLSFVMNIVNSVVVVVDIESLKHSKPELENLASQFSSVIFIFANAIRGSDVPLLESFQESVLKTMPATNVAILCTHRGNIEQNVVDMVATVSKCISMQISLVPAESIELKIKKCSNKLLKDDEEDMHCSEGKKKQKQYSIV